jgi:inositol phosphorylceramide mannosyltransferase catalytic subunit
MIPPLLHQTWKTKKIPKWAKAWHASWQKYNPNLQIMWWTDKMNRHLVKTYAPWFLKTYDAFPIHIQRVDAVRYLILYLYGGIYVDLDFECYKNIDCFRKYDLVYSYSGNMPFITNSIMMSRQNHPFWLSVLRTMQKQPPQKWYELKSYYVLRTTGPVMLDRVIQEYSFVGDRVRILPSKYFFPFTMLQKYKRDHYFPQAYGAHHHMCTWTNDHQMLKGIGLVLITLISVCIVWRVMAFCSIK